MTEMEKLKEAIADLKNINTNDPPMQRRVVKALEAVAEELDKIKHPRVYRNFGGGQ